MNQYMQLGMRLRRFIHEIYGNQPTMTRVEVDVEALSGGAYGTPHLETTDVRCYAHSEQLLPDFEGVPYWKAMLAAYPNVFQECTTHQDRLDTVQKLLEEEQLYLDYGLTWPDNSETFNFTLHFTCEELNHITSRLGSLGNLGTASLGPSEDRQSDNVNRASLPYAYRVSLTTHQMLYQDITVESETPLIEDEIIERAFEQAGNEWERGPIDTNLDVDDVQILRTKPQEQQESPSDGSSPAV